MDPNRWKTVNEIFHAALEISPGARQGFVATAAVGDVDLQAEVELLLQADANAGSFIESPLIAEGLQGDPTPPVTSGDVLCGRFRIVRAVAEGGMGHVFEAFDSELAVRVALKVIRPEISSAPEALSRFRQEVRLARSITHPNVCRTFDLERETSLNPKSGLSRDLVFLTMEFLEGETLAARIERIGALPLNETFEIARQIAGALQAAHSLGIVHRDMKPANVMLVPEVTGGGSSDRAAITDFGLARLDPLIALGNASALSHTARPIGTLAYMAPEQLQGGKVSAATDVYAFGLILFEMVTGRRAFPSDSFLKGIAQRLTGAAPNPKALVPSLPEPWCRAIEKCLQTDPAKRFDSASDAVSLLETFTPKNSRAANNVPVRLLSSERQRWAAIALAAVLFSALAAGTIYYRSHQRIRLNGKDTIVVADFTNNTGESVFDDALKTAMTVSLRQSPFLNVLPENRVPDIIRLMARPDSTQVTPELAREVCLRAESKAYIAGSIARLGNQYVLGLKAVNCQSGELLAQEQVTATGKERVLEVLGKAASKLRGELGESLSSVQEYDVPLADATTSSLEALKALSLGRKAYRKDTGVALQYFQEASELDPKFALAYHDLGRLYFTLDEMERGRANFARAFALRDHSSEREKLEIAATYYENVTGELEKALYTRRTQVSSYPHVSESYDGLGYVCTLLGRYDFAINMFRESIRLNPDSPDTYGLLANSDLAVEQREQASSDIQQAQKRQIDGLLLHAALYNLAFLKGDASEMTKQESWMRDQPQYENFGYSIASDSEAYLGHLREAGRLTKMAIDSSINADSKETAAIWYENAALREAAFGKHNEAKLAAASGLELEPTSLSVGVEAALAYGIAGDTARTGSLLALLSKHFSTDTQVQSLWLPAIRAQLDLNRNQPSSAIEDLQPSAPLEYGQYPFNSYGTCLYTTYLRGNAYLLLRQGKLAADEFQKILDHSGLVVNCWTGALARLGLARANNIEASALQGEDAYAARTRALFAYDEFLTLSKDADAGIPVVDQAKVEYKKLKSQIQK